MEEGTKQLFFALLRSAVGGAPLRDAERARLSEEVLPSLMELAVKHDVANLLVLGLQQTDLPAGESADFRKKMLKALYRYEQLNYEFIRICEVLEQAEIPFVPLKGTVLRQHYPEPWMRTSCDIDILLHEEDLERASKRLAETLQYEEKGSTPHDISMYSPNGTHVELHFDLVEEGRANNAVPVLRTVWEYASLYENSRYHYQLSDAFFYFYHIAHMAKHFDNGGCGVRPFIDLWILDRLEGVSHEERDALLLRGGLLQFANAARRLSRIWMEEAPADTLSLQLQDFVLLGGVYGAMDNRVMMKRQKSGKLRFFWSRVFMSYEQLKHLYPVLKRHAWLTPIMQVRRWFRILTPGRMRNALRELSFNARLDENAVEETNTLMKNIGL